MEAEFQQRKPQKTGTGRPNLTGIPTQMKLDFEQRSGMSFDDVRVHYGSDRPAQLQALAYTQGRHVYIGPGQERHLRHELGHVIQQKRGQVTPTGRVGGLPINDDRRLEEEADHLAGLAVRRAFDLEPPVQRAAAPGGEQSVVQRAVHRAFQNASYANANTPGLGYNAMTEWGNQIFRILSGHQRGINHAAILRASLVQDSNVPNPTGRVRNQAHHIVETSNSLGQAILQNAGIESDSAANGVLLPSVNHDWGGNASIHRGPHNWMYTVCVTAALWNAVASTRLNMQAVTLNNFTNVITLNNINGNITANDANTIINMLGFIRWMLLNLEIPLNDGTDGTYGQGTTAQQIYNEFHTAGLI